VILDGVSLSHSTSKTISSGSSTRLHSFGLDTSRLSRRLSRFSTSSLSTSLSVLCVIGLIDWRRIGAS